MEIKVDEINAFDNPCFEPLLGFYSSHIIHD